MQGIRVVTKHPGIRAKEKSLWLGSELLGSGSLRSDGEGARRKVLSCPRCIL